MSGNHQHGDPPKKDEAESPILLQQLKEPDTGPRMWLSDLSIKQPVLITMLVAAVLIVGSLLYSRMGMDLLPDTTMPIIVVQVTYPGASPSEIEHSVTKKVEDTVSSVGGVKNVTSSSSDSSSIVIIELNMEANVTAALDDIRTRINLIRNDLPSDSNEPIIMRYDPSQTPIMSIAISSKGGQATPEQLRTTAEDLVKARLERIPGVASVNIAGGVETQVRVDLNADKMLGYGVTPQQLIQAISGENLDIPAGRISGDGSEQTVKTNAQITSLSQLMDTPVTTLKGSTIKVSDLSTVYEGKKDVRYAARLDGNDTVLVQVQKQSGTNTVQIADSVKKELNSLGLQHSELNLFVASDTSTYTKDSVNDVQLTLVVGALLAALVVLLFFEDLRATIVTVAGLPVIIMGTFAVMSSLGMTLNTISLMALSLSIGMLIDDAIVVRENIFKHVEAGESPRAAASHGAAQIAMAVVAVSSTIVAVFLPIAFTSGIIGKFLRDFGLTVSVAVLISLVEAFTLGPMLCAIFFKPIDPTKKDGHRKNWLLRTFDSAYEGYGGVLHWALGHRAIVVIICAIALGSIFAILPFMSRSMMPTSDRGELTVNLELRPGARMQDAVATTIQAEEMIKSSQPGVEHILSTVGSENSAVNKSSLFVKLKSRGHTIAVGNDIRSSLSASLPGTKVTVQMASAMSSSSAATASAMRPVSYAVRGSNMEDIDRVSAELVTKLNQVPGLADVERTLKTGNPQLLVTIDRSRSKDMGISAALVGSSVRALINGQEVGTFRKAEKDLDIVVKLADAEKFTGDKLLRLPIATSRGSQVPLSSVASLVPTSEPSQIDRQNKERQVQVTANYVGQDQGAGIAAAEKVVQSLSLPEGVRVAPAGMTEMMGDTFSSLGLAMVLAVVFVYMILASQFGSFIHPFTIMLALPFSIIGAMVALVIFRFNLDMVAMIGMILLMGLVTKNSILLVEFVNQNKARGLTTREAILVAGPARLRPILMTTLAMILGMLPTAVGFGAGAELRQAMGVSIIGGMITSTLLTLIAVPVAYSLIDQLTEAVLAKLGRQRHAEAAPNSVAAHRDRATESVL